MPLIKSVSKKARQENIREMIASETSVPTVTEREQRYEAALKQIRSIPVMPFPDCGAHSERAFADAVWRAWSRIQQVASEALRAEKPC